MKRITSGRVRLASLLVGLLVAPWIWLQAQQPARGPVPIDSDDIGGVVTGPKGPEAGVWVVAETRSLPTGFARMVVTDDQGRYVLPDLPRGEYDVFVRGYGLIDSPRQKSKPGQQLNLTAQPAPNPAAAAQYYPAAYWAGMMDKPISAGCLACHEIGNKATREIPASITKAASSSLEAWDRRTAMGPEGGGMFASFKRLGADRQVFADWTDRVAKGELPRQTPPRPVGVERNLVVSWWDWGTKVDGRTDAAASDTRNATINADGKVYMVSRSDDVMAVLDPVEHRAQVVKIPSSAPFVADKSPRSAYWGEEAIWKRQAEPRSVALDDRGRVWLTARLREKPGLPAFCTSDTNKFAKYYSAASRGGRGGGGAYGERALLPRLLQPPRAYYLTLRLQPPTDHHGTITESPVKGRRSFDEHVGFFITYGARVAQLSAASWNRMRVRCADLNDAAFRSLLRRAFLAAKPYELWLPEAAQRVRTLPSPDEPSDRWRSRRGV